MFALLRNSLHGTRRRTLLEGMTLQETSAVSTKSVFLGGRPAQVVAPPPPPPLPPSTPFSTSTTTDAATAVSHPVGGDELLGWTTRGKPEQHYSILTPTIMTTSWSMPSETVTGRSSQGHDFSIMNLMTSFVKNYVLTTIENEGPSLGGTGIWFISTLKRRRKMMNKHKLRKRRKKNRMKSKK